MSCCELSILLEPPLFLDAFHESIVVCDKKSLTTCSLQHILITKVIDYSQEIGKVTFSVQIVVDA